MTESATPQTDALRLKLLARTIKDEATGCWLWVGDKRWKGYGALYHRGKRLQAHRLSYELYRGDIAPGLFVCHKCDVPSCINPEHLFLGSPADNTQDAANKGRLWNQRPEERPRVEDAMRRMRERRNRLSSADARSIFARAAKGERSTDIAKDFGIYVSLVSEIKARRRWADATKDL